MVCRTCLCTCTEKQQIDTSLHTSSFNIIPTQTTAETGFLGSFFCQLCLHLRVFRCTHSEKSDYLLKPQRRLFQGKSRYGVNQSVHKERLAYGSFLSGTKLISNHITTVLLASPTFFHCSTDYRGNFFKAREECHHALLFLFIFRRAFLRSTPSGARCLLFSSPRFRQTPDTK